MKKSMKRPLALALAGTALLAFLAFAALAEEPETPDVPMAYSLSSALTVYVDGDQSLELSGEYPRGENVTLTAPDTANSKTFSYWTLSEGGVPVGMETSLTLTVNADTTLYAVYGVETMVKFVAAFTSIVCCNYAGKDAIALSAICNAGSGGKVQSAGIRYTSNQILGVKNQSRNLLDGDSPFDVEKTLKSESVGGKVRVSIANLEDDVKEAGWTLYLTPSGGDTRYYAVVYAVVERNGDTETVYSDVREITFDSLDSGVSAIAELGDIASLIADERPTQDSQP